MSTSLQYPIGKFSAQPMSADLLETWIADIRFLPGLLEQSILNLDEAQLQTPYRDGGWTIKQVVHHVADSHMHAYIRFKLGLTEDHPEIKPYDEGAWALLEDNALVPVNVSLTLIHALHTRWTSLIEHMEPERWQRTVFHPQHQRSFSLWDLLGMYAWHGKHHVAHITSLRARMNW